MAAVDNTFIYEAPEEQPRPPTVRSRKSIGLAVGITMLTVAFIGTCLFAGRHLPQTNATSQMPSTGEVVMGVESLSDKSQTPMPTPKPTHSTYDYELVGVGAKECKPGLRVYDGNVDNPGKNKESSAQACAQACATQSVTKYGSWDHFGTASGFYMQTNHDYSGADASKSYGRCYCSKDTCANDPRYANMYEVFKIVQAK